VSSQDVFTGGDAPALTRVTVVALYNPHDGTIGHLHQVFAFEGSSESSEEAAVAAAHRNARRLGLDETDWRAAVSHDPEHGRRTCVIDVATGEFKFRDEVAEPSRGGRDSR
jgi:hypothetical protein